MRWIARSITALVAASSGVAVAQVSPVPDTAIDAPAAGPWTVLYTSSVPMRALVFARSPDRSRAVDWVATPEFEIAADARGELVRRRDGATFTAVRLQVPPLYRELPKDYAPFSRFGDGGVLFHSGRFFACADGCPARPRWRMSVRAGGRAVLVDGRRSSGTASWRDDGQGRSVYVGDAQPVETPDVLAVIDRTLPPSVAAQLNRDLPRFMRFYAAKLGATPMRPMLFVSHDARHARGWGRQGGTLPGQVFTHFYGAGWPERMAKPDFGSDLAWHLAHEAAHVHQRQLALADAGDAWMHEGTADAFAAIALRAQGDGAAADRKLAEARMACGRSTRDRALTAAVAGGDFDAAYTCGLLLGLAVHEAALARRPGGNGLFAVWRRFARGARGRDALPAADYLRAVQEEAGLCAARALAAAVRIPGGADGAGIRRCAQVASAASSQAGRSASPSASTRRCSTIKSSSG